MIIVISTSVIAVLFAYMSSIPKYKNLRLFQLAFIMITLIVCVRYNYGTDYESYYKSFSLTAHNPDVIRGIIEGRSRDPLWTLINWALPRQYGFFLLIAIIGATQNYIYYKFIINNVDPKDRWKALAIYLFTAEMYLYNFSMIRQGLAVALCVAATMCAGEKKYKRAIILIAIGVSIHITALIIVPFLLLSFTKLEKGKMIAIIYIVMNFALFFTSNFARNILNNVLSFDMFNRFAEYRLTISATDSVGLGFALGSIVYLVMIYFIAKRFNKFPFEQRLCMFMTCMSLPVVAFSLIFSSLMGRMGIYFTAFQMVTVPNVYKEIKNKIFKYPLVMIYVFMMFVGYINFFNQPWVVETYKNYHTIFNRLFLN